jgi:hypothetical protein
MPLSTEHKNTRINIEAFSGVRTRNLNMDAANTHVLYRVATVMEEVGYEEFKLARLFI